MSFTQTCVANDGRTRVVASQRTSDENEVRSNEDKTILLVQEHLTLARIGSQVHWAASAFSNVTPAPVGRTYFN